MRVGWTLGASLALLVQACGLNMEKHYRNMRNELASGDFASADKYIDSVKKDFYSEDNRLLYYMDKSVVLNLAKKYKESNVFLEKAKATADELWTESVGKNAAAWLTTDNSLPYQGEDFEKVLLHFIASLNFIGLQEYDAARVEARQIGAKLELYSKKYEEEADPKEKRVEAYRDDAFARWLSGKLAETERDDAALNDAWIDYKKSIGVYEQDYKQRYKTALPRLVVEDALRALGALGADFSAEQTALQARFPSVQVASRVDTAAQGEIVFLHLAGEAPYKIDKFWDAYAEGELLRIAFPEFVAKKVAVRGARLTVAGNQGQTELFEDINAIAIQNLKDHMARIKTKTIARAIAKYVAAKAAQAGGSALMKKGKSQEAQVAGGILALAGAAFQVTSAIAEEADKRSWITLPAEVHVGRVFAPPGEAVLDVELLGANGAVAERRQMKVTVEAGKPVFVALRTFE